MLLPGGKGFKGEDKGKWRAANQCRQLQKAIYPDVMPTPPPAPVLGMGISKECPWGSPWETYIPNFGTSLIFGDGEIKGA